MLSRLRPVPCRVSVRTIERWIVVFLSVAEASALDYFRSDGNGSVDQLFAFAEQIHLLPSLSAESARIAALLLFVTRVPPKGGKRANHKLQRRIRPLYNETFHVNRSRIIPRRLTSVFSFSMADTGSSDPLWYLNQCFQRVQRGELADVEVIFTFIQPPVDKIPLFRLEKTVGFKKMAKKWYFRLSFGFQLLFGTTLDYLAASFQSSTFRRSHGGLRGSKKITRNVYLSASFRFYVLFKALSITQVRRIYSIRKFLNFALLRSHEGLRVAREKIGKR